jgi:hypothetical protein
VAHLVDQDGRAVPPEFWRSPWAFYPDLSKPDEAGVLRALRTGQQYLDPRLIVVLAVEAVVTPAAPVEGSAHEMPVAPPATPRERGRPSRAAEIVAAFHALKAEGKADDTTAWVLIGKAVRDKIKGDLSGLSTQTIRRAIVADRLKTQNC